MTARLSDRQESIICELHPEHALISSATANELGELADLGIVDLRCGIRMAGLTPVGEVLCAYIVRVKKIEAQNRELRSAARDVLAMFTIETEVGKESKVYVTGAPAVRLDHLRAVSADRRWGPA